MPDPNVLNINGRRYALIAEAAPHKSLAAMLRARRLEAGLSGQEAAGLLGVSRTHLHAIEQGAASNLTYKTIIAFMNVYGIAPQEFFKFAPTGATGDDRN